MKNSSSRVRALSPEERSRNIVAHVGRIDEPHVRPLRTRVYIIGVRGDPYYEQDNSELSATGEQKDPDRQVCMSHPSEGEGLQEDFKCLRSAIVSQCLKNRLNCEEGSNVVV